MTTQTTVGDVCAFMDNWAPQGWAYPWDRVGLHTGDPQQQVERLMVCLSVTQEAVATAIQKHVSMIVAHHPLIWNPIKTLRTDIPLNRMYLDLCRTDIACFSAHTNLDVAPDGVNAALADRLLLQNTSILFREDHLKQIKLVTFVPETHQQVLLDALSAAGAGVIGDYSHCSFYTPGKGTFLPGMNTNPFCGQRGAINEEPEIRLEMLVDKVRLHEAIAALRHAHPYEEPAFDLVVLENLQENIGLGLAGELKTPMRHNDFLNYVQQQLALPFLISHGRNKGTISKVAVLGGSGGSYISRIPGNVDALVTGDVGYHDAETACLRGFTCIDASHYGTEFPIITVMATRLHKAFPAVKITTFKEKSGGGTIFSTKNINRT